MDRITLNVLIACTIMALSWIPTKAQESQKQETDTTVVLEDITAIAPMTRHLIDGDEYIITEQMRERSSNVAELLNLLPSVKVNRMDNSLSVENKNNVVLLVNGKRYSVDYIKSINPEKIVGVKVIKKPSGRYVSEGYDAIIDLKVRSYDGIDLSASNFMILNFNNNGHDKVMMEQPSVSFTYTQNRFSVFGSYAHGLSKWNTPYDNALTVENSYQLDGHGMEKYRYHGNVANIGANYRLSDNQELSAELDFRKEHTSSDRSLTNPETLQAQSVTNDNTNPTYGATLFYNGRLGTNLNVYSELAYSYLKNKVDNNFIEESQSVGTTIRENRHDIKYTLETEWKTSDWLSLKGGYQFGWKKYDSDNDFKYTDMRNKLWAYLTYNPSDVLSLEAGAAVELETIRWFHGNSHNYFRILPTAKINYTPSSKLNFNLAYTANGDYPTLAMLNPAQTILNKEVYQRGNPSLKPEVSHSIALENRFFDTFSANLQFDYAKNHIASLATAESGNVIFTYSNTSLKRLTVPLNFEYSIGRYLNLSIDAAYYVSWGKSGNLKRTVDGWWYGANLTYSNSGYMVDFGYSRSIAKENLLQGYEQTGIDSWTLTASKQWFGGRLTTMLTWFLPIDLGLSKHTKTTVQTDFYNEYTSQSLKPYRNAIVLNLIYRFNSGKNKLSHKRNAIETEERISGGLQF